MILTPTGKCRNDIDKDTNRTGAENGVNAVTNAIKREQEKKIPPKLENLADRYKERKQQ